MRANPNYAGAPANDPDHQTRHLRLLPRLDALQGVLFEHVAGTLDHSPKIRVISMIEAPKIMPSAIRKVIFRNGPPGCNQPMLTKYGTRALAMRPPTSAGTPTRAPTTIPAPMVDIERPVPPSHAILAVPKPPARPVNRPPPSVTTERLRSSGSVSARRMFATARPLG